ncbi:MAG: MOSC domain-containing protein [Rhodothermia bacterium]|nr:MOSC domain-containing protein [Rhodothermia bacterium]
MIPAIDRFSQRSSPGRVEWIGVRPARREEPTPVPTVQAVATKGLAGDHFAGKPGSARQVTLIQHEHLVTVGSILGKEPVDPGLLRRNIAISGINLLTLRDRRFRIGAAVLEGSGPCHPCSRMEENLGEGGLNAMRGHGGITARIIESGEITLGDAVVDLGPVAATTDEPLGQD